MARRKYSLSRKLGKATRKALTGSSASYSTQAKRKARKALTGSSLTLKTQGKRNLRKALTGSPTRPRRKGCGCATIMILAGFIAFTAMILVHYF